ncbi:MAG: mechanosensitive ion channel family protein [Ignavibacteriales bacterium]|nr:mechanosensitive ion channel family protein [Ignavibacteriales bacterium]
MLLLQDLYFGNSLQAWVTAAGVAVVAVLMLGVIKRLLIGRLSRIAETTSTDLDDLVVDLIKQVRFFFLLVISVYAGTLFLSLSPVLTRVTQSLVIISLLIQGALWGNKVIAFWLGKTMKKRIEEDAASATTLSALGFISRLLLWSVILLLALDNLGVNITTLVAGLGVGGIAIALALQTILGDLFSSLSIVLDKPFVIGDFIIVDEYLGSVEYIGLKTTRIRSLSGEQIIFSNSDLLQSRIRNYKRMFERRIVFTVGVTYQTPYEKVAWIPSKMKEIIEAQPSARFDRAHFKEYGDSALVYEAVYYVKSPDYNAYMDTQQAINLELFKTFAANGIDFAYPTRTLHVVQEPVAVPVNPEPRSSPKRGSP